MLPICFMFLTAILQMRTLISKLSTSIFVLYLTIRAVIHYVYLKDIVLGFSLFLNALFRVFFGVQRVKTRKRDLMKDI